MCLLAQKAYSKRQLLPQPLWSVLTAPLSRSFLFQHFQAHRCDVPDWGPDWEG